MINLRYIFCKNRVNHITAFRKWITDNRHTSFLTDYLADTVGEKFVLHGLLTFVIIQGHRCDFMIVSSENQYINCHVGINHQLLKCLPDRAVEVKRVRLSNPSRLHNQGKKVHWWMYCTLECTSLNIEDYFIHNSFEGHLSQRRPSFRKL